MKKCSKCTVEKDLFFFGKNKNTPDKLNCWCKECVNKHRREYYNQNTEKETLAAKIYRDNNPEKIRSAQKKNYDKYREEHLIDMKNYQKENYDLVKAKRIANKDNLSKYNANRYAENRETMLFKRKEWKQRNPEKVTAMTAKRRALKLNATPIWLTKEHHKAIIQFYKKAKELTKEKGEVYEVDHISPLVTKISCGLHVPWNLQVIPARVNRFKNNKILDIDQVIKDFELKTA